MIRILLVEDNHADARRTAALLDRDGGFELVHVERLSEAAARLDEGGYDAVLLDLMLPDSQGLDTIGRLQDRAPDVPIIVHSGFGADDLLLPCEAARGGAQDFLPKGLTDAPLMRRTVLVAIERKRLERRRVRWARHDELTGLPNRFLLEERFERAALRARRAGKPLAALAVELDHFVNVVEQMGRELGERLLRAVAERLRGVLRRTDTLARPGRRGFVALVEGLRRPEDAGVVAGKLLRYLARPFYLDGHEIHL
ncbi:MAG TPA: diguanylate cyclase, partial [Geminicoccaceae bacterium]|nr:diguanylate cyclase [Geminicoccaceae bacterium]